MFLFITPMTSCKRNSWFTSWMSLHQTSIAANVEPANTKSQPKDAILGWLPSQPKDAPIRDVSILRIWYPLGSWNQFLVDTKGKLHLFHPRWFPQGGGNSTMLSSFCHFDFFYWSSFFFNRRIMTILCWFLPHIKTWISHRYTCAPSLLSLPATHPTALGHSFSYCDIIIISWGSRWQGSQQWNTVPAHPRQKPLTLLCRILAIPLSLSHSTLVVGSVVPSMICPRLVPGSLLSVAGPHSASWIY